MKIDFITSVGLEEQLLDTKLPEIALAGRSNAGKSSFINGLARRSVAKVSQMPGKTICLNFFKAGENYRLVDMPGYGFAKRDESERQRWTKLIESYLMQRENLAGLALVVDIRRDWSDDEALVVQYVAQRGLPVALVLTKADQVARNDIKKRQQYFIKESGLTDVFVVSKDDFKALEEVEEFFFRQWVKK